jgi:endothelin-converting enzyme
LPADKDSFSNFEALAQKNKQLIQQIIEEKSVDISNPYDKELLKKLSDQYHSCLNEDHLNEAGEKPLLKVVKTLKNLYREKDAVLPTEMHSEQEALGDKPTFKFNGLTAATAFLHSRGAFGCIPNIQRNLTCSLLDIPALFGFDIEGDVAADPNQMVLWFSQPELGLPAKVRISLSTVHLNLTSPPGILRRGSS